ncbi:hypothetical protein FH972_020691 [Carpinus fangiana]|uniref:DHHA1 domain-containing protein n=1 Tax=Carpinus fangiana TaxID=176857 RepID=A0A5N6RX68_9ROSI|nr:hypothetical protein FH972_020691 [Carpinus fangiana]
MASPAVPSATSGMGLANTMKSVGKTQKASAILYHYPCPDGAFAALAAHLYFAAASLPALFFPNTVYRPITAQQLPLSEIGDLYLLDFVGSPGVVVLDHHKTALEKLAETATGENVTKVIDMERSGATIAFDYFKEKLKLCPNQTVVEVGEFDRLGPLFKYIEDVDLWRWRLPNSKAFSSGLKDSGIEFDVQLNPSLFQQLLSLDVESVISQGKLSLLQKQKLIDESLSQSYEIALGGGLFGHCLAADADSISELRSELGHQLARKSSNMKLRGIGAVVYRVPELENDQLLKISLRSVDNEDTTPISEEFGGGGHASASSFMLSSAELELWKVRKNSLT